ncbi:MAG: S8 family serine peptidase [Halobacteriales archaeon]|nr:S8 family serine peptidase [Halobacteriales archaeon]
MRSIPVSFVVVAAVFALVLVPAVSAADDFVVRLPDAESPDGAEELVAHAEETQASVVEDVRAEGGEVLRRFWLTNALLVRGDEDLRASLEERDGVRVHENHRFAAPAQTDAEATPTALDVKPGVEQVNATGVWEEFGVRGDGVRVAVLDTGVNVSHPDIDLRTTDADDRRYPGGWAEFDATGERLDTTPRDAAKHGTHVSGTVAGGNASGMWIGVAPEAELMHAKVFDSEGGTFARILAGMEWAVSEEADVLSLSFGVQCAETPVYVSDFVAPVRNAHEAGSLVVSATGNDGEGCSSSPGNVYDSLAVGAVNSDGDVPEFSSGAEVETTEAWGETAPSDWPSSYVVPDVTAPGVGVLSAVPDGGYERMDGTSMAVPHVVGVAVLVESSTEPDLTPAEHRAVLLETAIKPGDSEPDTRHGVGIVDAYDAVVSAQDGVEVPDVLPTNTTETGDEETDETETPSSPLPGFGVAAVLVAVLFAVALRKTTYGSRDTE